MTPSQLKNLKKIGMNGVHFDYPLGEKSTFRAGGNVEALCEVSSADLLRELVGYLGSEAIPYRVLGRGSNILVKDEGLEGVVILLEGEFERIASSNQANNELVVGAGASLFDLLMYCRDRGLTGLEFLAGIPGKVGGAVCMNAGAFGGQMGDRIVAVEMMDRYGSVSWIDKGELDFGYRHFNRPIDSIVLRTLVSLVTDSAEAVRQRIVGYLKEKKRRQPIDLPSAGSVFRNPPGGYAGRMIEAVGLKGRRIGGAMISEKHANFIVNIGGATAGDIISLIELIKEKVKHRFNTDLELEIEVLG
ncbi:MAG TPA: UDP-N-acetylmuramate dehydrogenase [Desulfobacteraceae bacterium]|nr:UDP-N-acetylmuramate dehydrogenase [Deltaproteobacteria bacterium]HDM10841.1 UDP-N-acetylmuramate dehydrogenase [Desulfobacteraceae bacterium]